METETTEIQTFVKTEHASLATQFCENVSNFLKQPLKIKSYGIDCNSYHEVEALKVDLDSNRTLEVKITRMV